jgi:flagellar motor switch protein FliM
MSWRSWLFPHSPTMQAEKAIREASDRTNAVMEPINGLVVGIVSASWQCTQEVKPHLHVNPEFMKAPHTPKEQDIYISTSFSISLCTL